MAEHSTIEWTDATWNPVTGCSIVSPGCANCYAMKLAGTRLKHHPSRAGLTVDSKNGPVWNGKVRFNEQWLDQPLRWRRPRMIFVCAHGDLFHEDVPDEWIDRVYAGMAETWWHTYQVLTKRSARMRAYFAAEDLRDRIGEIQRKALGDNCAYTNVGLDAPWPLPHVWLGVSAERQKEADERIPDLLATSAAIRFLSAEPLLGPIDLSAIRWQDEDAEIRYNALTAEAWVENSDSASAYTDECDGNTRLDWVIAGGESGDRANPMHPGWARALRDQCVAADVPFFFKQWGNWSAVSQMSEEQIDACYPPLSERHPDATRHPLVDECVLHADGSRHRHVDRNAFLQGTGAMTMFEVGKKRAGRLLDGVKHDGMPQPREVPAL
ncbi:phage Gp37/Gp68 family protein [Neoaquamicrobium sediminum]|uniref:phage Gp37/Gp68 family protein n=1 Tax=Neoaquamicrobium sediminum TaxID=1849104 RepID=UPI003BA918F1